jgi:dephospho-CoA kinase
MIIAGLTGGAGSGKSTVAKIFLERGIPVINADHISNVVLMPNTLGHQKIVETFGKEYVTNDGTINSSKLGAKIFSDADALFTFNSIHRPMMQEETARRFQLIQQAGFNLAIFDSTLIIEGGDADKYRPLILVHCPLDIQIGRLSLRKIGNTPLSKEQIHDLIKFQMPVEQKLTIADYAIDTSQTPDSVIRQTENIIQKLHQ